MKGLSAPFVRECTNVCGREINSIPFVGSHNDNMGYDETFKVRQTNCMFPSFHHQSHITPISLYFPHF